MGAGRNLAIWALPEFRQASVKDKMMKLAVISFTVNGTRLNRKLCDFE